MSTKELMLECDTYIVKALEFETENINRLNSQAGLAKIGVSEVAREVLADWAINLLLSQPEPKKNRDTQTQFPRAVN